MKLFELEKQLGFTFPEAFHTIYETGAMKWLEMSREELKNNREKYISDSKAFLMLNCDCEPYLFDEIPETIERLKKWIVSQEQDRNISLSEEITLIPFGHNGGGDLYCFLVSKTENEPMIILYYHDEYGNPKIIGHDFDEFLYVQMLDAVENEEDINGENYQNQMWYLNVEYRQKLVDKDVDMLLDDYDSIVFDVAKIWC
mgnify:CR=1 FL=1